ncbi:major facilitator superfamily transporter [Aphelenchoides avenae]|nr:major facilitator superfamily transporter [Aphelenchus avenae]
MPDPVARFLTTLRPATRISLVIFSAVLIHLSLGTYHTFGNMLPYMRSYASFLFTYGFMFGFGQGVAYVTAVACVINWAPHMVGFGSGIVAAGFGISSSIFAPIQTRLVNPLNLPPTRDGYFQHEQLLDRVPGVFFSMSIVYMIMQCIGLIFVCDPPADFVKKHFTDSALIDMAWLSKRRSHWLAGNSRNVSFAKYGYVRLPLKRDAIAFDSPSRQPLCKAEESNGKAGNSHEWSSGEESEADTDLNIRQAPQSLTPDEMLHSSTFYFLFAALFCCSFYGNFFYNLYKTFGETFISDDFFLAMAFAVGSVANAFARIGWGLLTDKTSFQVALSAATCLATGLLLTMPLTASLGRYAYLLWLTLMFVCLGATHALFITAAVRCFGTKHKAVNYGCLILSTTFSGILLAVGSQYFLQLIGYGWAFVITAVFPFTAFLLTSAIRITPQGHLIV